MRLLKQYSKLLLISMSLILSACQMTPVQQEVETQQQTVDPVIMKNYLGALDLMRTGYDDAAIKILQDIVGKDDRLSGPYANLGLLYLKQDKPEQAKTAFEEALKRNPVNVTALNQTAIFQRKAGEFRQARVSYEAALAEDPGHANAHLNLAIVCDTYLQDLHCALQHFEQYQQLQGEDDEVKNWIIDLKERM